jgi:hypothetical protein
MSGRGLTLLGERRAAVPAAAGNVLSFMGRYVFGKAAHFGWLKNWKFGAIGVFRIYD